MYDYSLEGTDWREHQNSTDETANLFNSERESNTINLSISNGYMTISGADLSGVRYALGDYFSFEGLEPIKIKVKDTQRDFPQAKAAITQYLKRKGLLESIEHTGNGSWTFALKDVKTANRKFLFKNAYQPKELTIVSNNLKKLINSSASKEQIQEQLDNLNQIVAKQKTLRASMDKLNRMAVYTSEKELLEQELSQRAKESYG